MFLTSGKVSVGLNNDILVPDRLRETTTSTINDENWYHIGFTYDGSADATGLHIYLDGIFVPTVIDSETLGATIKHDDVIRLGAGQDGGAKLD